MSQAASDWLEIIQEILGEFHVVKNAAPEWLVDQPTGSRLPVDRLYPELGLAVRIKGKERPIGSGEVDFMSESARDALYEQLSHKADITLITIAPDKDQPEQVLSEIQTALSRASRRIAQRPVTRGAKQTLLPAIASARATSQRIAEQVSTREDLLAFVEAQTVEGVSLQPIPSAPPEPEPIAEIEKPSQATLPVQPQNRIEFVDILRGFALLGVLIANMALFSGQSTHLQARDGTIDRIVLSLIRFLVTGKFYSLLALLFGWGVAVQMQRTKARGISFLPLFVRRLLVLLTFGLLHGFLIWWGDVLTAYALLGFLVLPFRKRSNRVVLGVALLAWLSSILLKVPIEPLAAFQNWNRNLTTSIGATTSPQSVFANGTYFQVARHRAQLYLKSLTQLIYYGDFFALMLLGYYVGRRQILRNIGQYLSLLRRVLWIGLVLGVAFNGLALSLLLWPSWLPVTDVDWVREAAGAIGAPALMLFYACAIALLVHSERWPDRLAAWASVGRSALSNYLLQSVLGTLLFYGYGLGLYGQVSPSFGLILSVGLFYFQVQLSAWWLDRHAFGPVEWLWRTLTYLRPQLRSKKASATADRPLWGRMTARMDPRVVAAGLAIALLFCSAAFALWTFRPQLKTTIEQGSDLRAVKTPASAQRVTPSENLEASAIATPIVQPVAYEPSPLVSSGDLLALASSFDAESALSFIEELTGPPYLGRYAGSPEGWAAGAYIAREFERLGLQPAGDNGTFFQAFPIEYQELEARPQLIVLGPDGTRQEDYQPHRDFAAAAGAYVGEGSAQGDVIWASDCTHDDLDKIPVVEKIVFCRYNDLRETGRNVLEHGGAGLLLLTEPEQRPPDFGAIYRESWVPVPIPAMLVYPSVAADLLQGSGYAVSDLSINYGSFSLATDVQMQISTIGAEACAVPECLARNVLGVIPGRDPEAAKEIIILGAHYDHLGQTPDGTTWAGANDDASGVAVLLEIARSWQTQGYVPRHTVLFAAWDAEEMGLLGSRHYVTHPRYPLEQTLAKIQFDMVGAGGDVLMVHGRGELQENLSAVAEALKIPVEKGRGGGSDHVPFLEERVPASLLIWGLEDASISHYHRPVDTPQIIDPGKLGAVGRIGELTVLGLTEGEVAIADLLNRRAAALVEGNLDAFLATSDPTYESLDHAWFAAMQKPPPLGFEMNVRDLRILGHRATADVKMSLTVPADGTEAETQEKSASLKVEFTFGETGWQWAGPHLKWVRGDEGFLVGYPPHREPIEGLGRQAAKEYARIVALLELPTESDAKLLLLPKAESLRASVDLELPIDQKVWINSDAVNLIFDSDLGTDSKLSDALVQLALAEAGVTEAAAPWLWRGLPLVWQARTDPIAVQSLHLPRVVESLENDEIEPSEATSWAAVAYLQQRIGWQGLGAFIAALGQTCGGQCSGPEALNAALLDATQMDAETFAAAWQAHWRDMLMTARADLNAVLAAREAAILAGNEQAFLSTVSPDVPGLKAEQQHWFAELKGHTIETYAVSGEPLAVLENGDVLARMVMQYRLSDVPKDRNEASLPLRVSFRRNGDSLLWAGRPFEMLEGRQVQVLYPQGEGKLAQAILEEADTVYSVLADTLTVTRFGPLTLKLYKDSRAFRTSIDLAFPSVDWAAGWTARDESVKLRLNEEATLNDYRPTLALQLARHLLIQNGVDSEWLIKGGSFYLTRNLYRGMTEQMAGEYLSRMFSALSREELGSLAEVAPDHRLSEDQFGIARAQAWDAIRYLTYAHGQEAWQVLYRGVRQGLEDEAALQRATGQDLVAFEAAWAQSLQRAHANPEWIGVARGFDPEKAREHIAHLADPALEGRRAGSAEAEEAATYIADQFAALGLEPAGDLSESVRSNERSFYQRFPISDTYLLAAPSFALVNRADQTLEQFTFREHYLPRMAQIGLDEVISGELVWVQDESYAEMDLSGKIVLRRPSLMLSKEAERAKEHGAQGLIVLGNIKNPKEYLAKGPFPVEVADKEMIPVLELTQDGGSRLLELIGRTMPDLLNSPPAFPLGVQVRMEIPLSPPEAAEAINVLGWLPGSDPSLRQEVIVLGAHYDHVGDDPDAFICPQGMSVVEGLAGDADCEIVEGRRYPGANDDASGVGVLLEMLRLWRETGYRPKRSVLVAAWGAQEMGQIGSRYYVQNPTFPLDQIAYMWQLDAVGGGAGYFMEAVGFREQEGLQQFNLLIAEDLVEGRLKLAVPPEDNSPSDRFEEQPLYISVFEGKSQRLLSSGQSDQIPFHQLGISALLVSWRGASEDNWPAELADEVEPYRLGITGRMVTLAVMALAQ